MPAGQGKQKLNIARTTSTINIAAKHVNIIVLNMAVHLVTDNL